ncbi:hypothetical protein HU200_065637 [Digitaria exilis]|uniref:non-specific serine/threonine protein kinase n=1 Tax=Digitaria exilis TaxID=1010633 RepID=A0A835A3K4_9POAL|nr:hypothetical protein HU200_065637 [Digitaria exilis]
MISPGHPLGETRDWNKSLLVQQVRTQLPGHSRRGHTYIHGCSELGPVSGAQQATANISSGASLEATAGAAWTSPSGRFAFGFYATDDDGGLAVGVWLATAPNATPATGGRLWITYDGRLVWSGNDAGQDRNLAVPSSPAVAGAMRDDGSFVLYGANGTVFVNVAAAAYWDTGTFQIGFALTLRLDATKNLTQPVEEQQVLYQGDARSRRRPASVPPRRPVDPDSYCVLDGDAQPRCQAACVSDCLCAAALLDGNDGTCTKQQLPLRYGRAGGGYTLFVKTGQARASVSGRNSVGRRATIKHPPWPWKERLGIALDVARGLHYLHDELERRVIHCDVKPHNILMDAQADPQARPDMRTVILMLEGHVQVPFPPPPASAF